MSREQNIETAKKYIKAIGQLDVEGCIGLMSDDAIYWVPGKPELFPAAGEKTIPEFRQFLAAAKDWHGPLTHDIVGITADEDRVAIEATSDGMTTKGKRYNNTYHLLFQFKDGKISKICEYTDTLYVKDVFEF